jgi:hypothetical protein
MPDVHSARPARTLVFRKGGLNPAHVPDIRESMSDLGHCGEKIAATDVIHRSYIEVVERSLRY